MEKITNILWSLIPLILIILFSWLFSLMGSKAKKQMEGRTPAEKEGTGSPLLDMLLNAKADGEEIRPTAAGQDKMVHGSTVPMNSVSWPTQSISGPTPISSDPITPKWWGA
jgi:hypothetical protein